MDLVTPQENAQTWIQTVDILNLLEINNSFQQFISRHFISVVQNNDILNDIPGKLYYMHLWFQRLISYLKYSLSGIYLSFISETNQVNAI